MRADESRAVGTRTPRRTSFSSTTATSVTAAAVAVAVALILVSSSVNAAVSSNADDDVMYAEDGGKMSYRYTGARFKVHIILSKKCNRADLKSCLWLYLTQIGTSLPLTLYAKRLYKRAPIAVLQSCSSA